MPRTDFERAQAASKGWQRARAKARRKGQEAAAAEMADVLAALQTIVKAVGIKETKERLKEIVDQLARTE